MTTNTISQDKEVTKAKPIVLERWHQCMKEKNFKILEEMLSDEAVLYSPVVHTPQRGKHIVKMYLMAASSVFLNSTFAYTKEIIGEGQMMLEFETIVDDIKVNGVDIISYNENNQITEFKVMVRPLQGVQMIHQKMMEMLAQLKK